MLPEVLQHPCWRANALRTVKNLLYIVNQNYTPYMLNLRAIHTRSLRATSLSWHENVVVHVKTNSIFHMAGGGRDGEMLE